MEFRRTIAAAGIERIEIHELARDSQLRGRAGVEQIDIIYQADREYALERAGDLLRLGGMRVQRVEGPAGLSISVESAGGDVHVDGLAGEIAIGNVNGDLRLQHLDGQVRAEIVNGDLRADQVSRLEVSNSCNGDLRFNHGGDLIANSVNGDLRARAANSAQIGRVSGDLVVERLQGSLRVQRVDGDVVLAEITGPVAMGTVGGDLRGDSLLGGLAAERVAGDADLRGALGQIQSYVLNTDGDANIYLPAEADLRLAVSAAGRIRSGVHLTPASDGTPTFTATLGSGAGRMSVTCGGDLRIKQPGAEKASTPPRMEDMADRIRQQVNASLAAAGIPIDDVGEVRVPRPPRPPQPPPPMRPAAGRTGKSRSEEQLAVLHMLESGNITAEEAETLLRALGA